jgi:hypothetical protein
VFSVRWSVRRLYNETLCIPKRDMICSVKPALTEGLCIVHKEEIFNSMLYV